MAAGFIEKLLSLFINANDPEAVKKRRLKQLAKELSRNKYARFFKPKSGEIDGSLGKLFYDIYKVIAPAQVFLQNASKSAQLKQIVVETFFDKNLEEIKQRLTPEVIEEKVKSGQKDLGKSLSADFSMLNAALNSEKISSIDKCYNSILAMAQFCAFDYYFLVKRFDSKIMERSFSYQPKFTPIRGEYLKDDLKDFLEVSSNMDPELDWKSALAAIKTYKNGIDVVIPAQWNKLLLLLRDIRKNGILEQMIRYIDQKPDWISKPRIIDEHIAEKYIENKRAEIKTIIDKALNARKNAKIESLVKAVFGTTEINRVKFYSEKNSEIYTKKNLDGFIHSGAINYLKAFLLDYLKRDLRELYDLLLIRGQWTDLDLSRQTSDHFHKLMEISDKIVAFDESMADNGETGARLKAALIRADRDRSQANSVSVILKTVNDKALDMIKQSAISLTIIGKSIKMLADDQQKITEEMLLLNWKMLEGISEAPLNHRLAEAYKKLYYFIQLIQAYLASGTAEKPTELE